MEPREGVIRFAVRHVDGALPAEAGPVVDTLETWRRRLRALGFIGQAQGRYDGAAWGNVSARLGPDRFVISGTQTGGRKACGPEHYALVTRVALDGAGTIESRGRTPPSSEAMTHAAVYAHGPLVGFVFHGHHPEPWAAARALGLATTPGDVEYGTPAMARAVAEAVLTRAAGAPPVLAMLGHLDGVLGWGPTADAAGLALEEALRAARAVAQRAGR